MADLPKPHPHIILNDRVEDEVPVSHIKVTNRNTFDIEDMFDSKIYRFPSGETVTIQMDVARHVFGFHLGSTEAEVKQHCMKRFGWNTPDIVQDKRNDLFFRNIEIRPVRFRMVEVRPEEDPTPRPRQKLPAS